MIFSQDPSMLPIVITGCVDFKFDLVKFGEYINRDSIKVQSYSLHTHEGSDSNRGLESIPIDQSKLEAT